MGGFGMIQAKVKDYYADYADDSEDDDEAKAKDRPLTEEDIKK